MAGFILTKTKRKDFDGVYDEFSEFSLNSPARKIRRLDAELPPIMEEEDPTVPLGGEQQVPEGFASPAFASTMPELESGMIDAEPPIPLNEERALVLYKPVDSPFAGASSFSFQVHSDLVNGLKNQAFWPANPNVVRVEEIPADEKPAVANNNLAVVPWVPSQSPSTFASESRVALVEEPMEAEEDIGGASMEVEEDRPQGIQQWPQHCLIPQPLQNTSTPIMWSWG